MSRSQQAGPAGKFLPDGQRHSILQMGAADLHNIVEFLGLGRDRIVHAS